MKLARLIQINATDATLLSRAPPIQASARPCLVSQSFAQQLFLSRLEGGSQPCHIQIRRRLRRALQEAALQLGSEQRVARHAVLRTTFDVDDGKPFQQIGAGHVSLPLKRDNLTPAVNADATLSELLRHETRVMFELEAGPVIRGRLVSLAADEHMLPTTMQKDRQSEYWLWTLAGAPKVLAPPMDRPRPGQQDYRGSFVELALDEAMTAQLKALSRHYRTTLFAVLLAGSASVLDRLPRQKDLVIGTPSDNSACSVGLGDCIAQHDLAGDLADIGGAIRGKLISATSLFERSTVERLASYLQYVLSTTASAAEQQVWSAPLLSPRDRRRLLVEGNAMEVAYLQDRCIHELFDTQAERDQEVIAGGYDDQSLSNAANALAISGAPRVRPRQSTPSKSNSRPKTVVMKFIEGARVITKAELQANNITRYHVTKFYREQITNSGHYDQLKHVVEPSLEEFQSPGTLDTSGEHDNTVLRGLQHKYPQTGLVLLTDRCASYCRYCFRKRIVGKDSGEIGPDLARLAQYISGHPEMTNVLLSGGDPFVLSTVKLNEVLDHLLPIQHLESIRFGTKMLAFKPNRFEDPSLRALFQRIHEAGKTAVIVTHFDHVAEISVNAERNIRFLRAQGVQFLNQSVLLAKVNDDPEILAATFAKCHQVGVRPYYLFQGRPVKGASHFQVSLCRGLEITRGINQRLSGIQKTFKYIMSHYTGKIEILDLGADGRVYMRYHQNKTPERIGKIFSRPHVEGACWLDELPEE
ncbi:KamA family protein [Bradyrhizobium sp. i1.15.2]|uniref:condensation domain-containing protein n=1 Tax=Bradyrhizobium sp. i1.15.2 TaxID=3156362 RepID=UPI003399F6B5